VPDFKAKAEAAAGLIPANINGPTLVSA